MSRMTRLKAWAAGLKTETRALYLAYRHPDLPLHVKVFLACVLAYALSPIDLIPDFIPVLGQLDDLILLPLGIWLAVRMIPPDILSACRRQAQQPLQMHGRMPWVGAAVILLLWLTLAICLARMLWPPRPNMPPTAVPPPDT